ncbi:hypothetical protein F183_A20590 [Bryobacterales bacterium F-183]|nr:hypothetical protein F183_A20590 [Bryobacterales bacterium F-183]
MFLSGVFAWLLLLVLGQDQQARAFISQFTVHGEIQIEGYGPASMRGLVSSGCSSAPVYTDAKGRFALTGTISNQGGATCTVTLHVPGCESREIQLTRPAGGVGLGTVVLKPLRGAAAGKAGGTISYLSLLAPPEVQKLRAEARKEAEKKNAKGARGKLEKAVAQYERDPEAWYELGLARKELGDEGEALAAFRKAVELDKQFALPWVQIQLLAMRHEKWDEVIEAGDKALALNPTGLAEAWLYQSMAQLKKGVPNEAEKSARAAIEAAGKAGLPKAHHLLGIALGVQGRNAEAVAEMRRYLELAPKAPDAALVESHIQKLTP